MKPIDLSNIHTIIGDLPVICADVVAFKRGRGDLG